MRTMKWILTISAIVIFITAHTSNVQAHCDRENGPVAVAAKEALKSGDFSKVVIWVGEAQEKELKSKFEQALAVYSQGGESKELAKQYFMETAVRLHREAEGFPYTGLKPAMPSPPDIEAAEKALQTGSFKPVIDLLTKEMDDQTSKWFKKAYEARKTKDQSIEKGREWVDVYVKYITFVHGLYKTIEKGPKHGVGD